MSAHIHHRRLVLLDAVRVEHPVDGTNCADLEINVSTNGTTAVNVFGSKGAPFAGTITNFEVTALDTTAGNITLKINSNTVATIAKGTSAGGITGIGAALTTVAFNPGDAVTLVSSSAGNALCWIAFNSPKI
jgi:hypothetical protein